MINKYAGIEYEDVVRQYADDITRLCVVWTQNEEAAKDCFQNTFLKLYQTEQTFREEEHIKAWLYTVARNECRDYHRQESKCGYWICATGEPKGWLFANRR